MKRLSILLIFVYLIKRMIFPLPVCAISTAGSSAVLVNVGPEIKPDIRARQLEEFLRSYNSPLAVYSDYFVKMADKYEIDWRLIPAITGVESTFGKNIPFGSYNAYGWGNGLSRFKSWEESIDHVTKALAEKYVARGLDTPREISPVYCPPNPTWGSKVEHFMAKIEDFGKKEADNILDNLLLETI